MNFTFKYYTDKAPIILRTVEQWEQDPLYKDVQILDYDGFRGFDKHTYITRTEFEQRLMECTQRFKPHG